MVIYIIMLIDSWQGPMIELVHMTETIKKHTHWSGQNTKIECEYSINEITAKIMRHADIETV